MLENDRYRIRLNSVGDVTSIFDKQLNRELLEAPMRLVRSNRHAGAVARVEYGLSDQQKPPRGYERRGADSHS